MMTLPFDNETLWQIAAAPNAATLLFSHIREGLRRDAGCGLMTASVYDLTNMRSRRVFSENPQSYPIGNFKRVDRNLYFDRVIIGKRHFSSTTIEEIADVFFDWEKIRDLGFESNLNIPAIASGEVIGSVNLLEKKGHYTRERVEKALLWQPAITLAFLLLLREGAETATFTPKRDVTDTPEMEGA